MILSGFVLISSSLRLRLHKMAGKSLAKLFIILYGLEMICCLKEICEYCIVLFDVVSCR